MSLVLEASQLLQEPWSQVADRWLVDELGDELGDELVVELVDELGDELVVE